MLFFLHYDDNTHTHYIHNLLSSLEQHGPEFKIITFHKSKIGDSFLDKYHDIFQHKRLGGYALWKPYIINETLKKINYGDCIFYLDSKYYFTEPFQELYSDVLGFEETNTDILVWKNKPNESNNYMKNYCKMDVIKKYDMEEKVFVENAEDCWSGAIMIRKTPNTESIMKEWLHMCCNYHDITDEPSIIPNQSEYDEHRHDQALLSIVLHKHNIPLRFFENKYLQNIRYPW
jgi:hypothetical protein